MPDPSYLKGLEGARSSLHPIMMAEISEIPLTERVEGVYN